VNQNAKNGNGSIAVNLPQSLKETSDTATGNHWPPTDDAADGEAAALEDHPPEPDGHEGSASKNGDEIIEIKEKMFIAQTNDVYFNAQDYLGKTIKYEGILQKHIVPEAGATYYSVIRYGPGCCGIDANAGFEVSWEREYPAQNDWVEAVGVLEVYDEDGYKYLRLALKSLTVLATRGAEYVRQ
jgi:uncharacterized membrane protein YcgQ (UPF0703/DUF1980 family)